MYIHVLIKLPSEYAVIVDCLVFSLLYIQNLPAALNLMSLVLTSVWEKFCQPSTILMQIHCLWKRVSCNPVDVNATLDNVHTCKDVQWSREDNLLRRNPIEDQAISGFSGQKSVPE